MSTSNAAVQDTIEQMQIAQWSAVGTDGAIIVKGGLQKFQMSHSDATGTPLVKRGKFGADVIRFEAGRGVMNHTHEGDHILFVIKGTGIVEYDGTEYDLVPGVCYLIPGCVDHAIKARTELLLIAVGNDHAPVDSVERMTPVWEKAAEWNPDSALA
jgi:quercetin dioxygenase-like cupin family protein